MIQMIAVVAKTPLKDREYVLTTPLQTYMQSYRSIPTISKFYASEDLRMSATKSDETNGKLLSTMSCNYSEILFFT